MSEKSYDVIMVGGGVMGCATAYYLLKYDPQIKVSNHRERPHLRIQFNRFIRRQSFVCSSISRKISRFRSMALKMLETFADDMAVDDVKPDVAFRQQGNLFLADEAGKEASLKGLETQQSLGCPVEWLDPAQVKERFPLYEVDQLAGGTFGSTDGTMDANAVLMGYKNKAVELGAEFIVDEVLEIVQADGAGQRRAPGFWG